MRIAIAIEFFDPTHGGAERSTDRIARELSGRGHDVTILAGGAPPDRDFGDLRIERWRKRSKPRTGRGAIDYGRWVGQRIFSGDFDTGVSMTTTAPAPVVEPRAGVVRENMRRALAAAGFAALRRAGQMLSMRKRGLLRAEYATFHEPRVHRFVAISGYIRRQMIEHYGVADARVQVIRNACEVEPVTADERVERRAAARQRYGWDDGEHVVFFPALDARRKGLAPLLRAAARLAPRVPGLRLALAGRVPPWGERLASSLGLADRIDTLGVVEHMRDAYCGADVTAMPTYYDPASRIVIESIAAGTPVVTTRFDGSADWIDDDATAGVVVNDPDDTERLAAAIGELLEGPWTPPAIDPHALGWERHVDELERVLVAAAR
ncbi:MAG: glycosyltransferase family 4 protein [Planctomycetes bacterium]|nr:glycosyltransferase family 4 protein [Planctomycetota bacterium]